MLRRSTVAALVASMASMSTVIQAESPDALRSALRAGTCVLALNNDGSTGGGVPNTIAVNDVVADVVKGIASQGADPKDPYYMLPHKEIGLDIACASPTAVAITVTDNRAASKPPAARSNTLMFGLGKVGSRSIGFFQVMLNDVEVKRSESGAFQPNHAIVVRSKDRRTGAWRKPSEEVKDGFLDQAFAIGYTTMPSATPAAISRLKGVLEIYPFVLKQWVDAPASPVTLDGSVTIGMEYL
jgi:hypothetical protein